MIHGLFNTASTSWLPSTAACL